MSKKINTEKMIVGRNPRFSLEVEEVKFLKDMIDAELRKSQKFDREKIYFLIKLYKKLEGGSL